MREQKHIPPPPPPPPPPAHTRDETPWGSRQRGRIPGVVQEASEPGRHDRSTDRSGAAPLHRLASVACLLLALVGLAPVPAQAQVVDYINNTGTDHGDAAVIIHGAFPYSQPFETGSQSGGYPLLEVVLRFRDADTDEQFEQFEKMEVTIRENSVDADSRNVPGATLYTLKTPAVASASGLTAFRAPPGATLAADTVYHIVVQSCCITGQRWAYARRGDLMVGGAEGWDIDFDHLTRTGARPNWHVHRPGYALLASVRGGTRPTTLFITDAARVEESDTPLQRRADFTVYLDRDVTETETVTVDWATSDGTATAGADYTAGMGSLTFNAGEDSKTVSVLVADDNLDEPPETFTVMLSNPSGAVLGDDTGYGTIIDDDSPPSPWLVLTPDTITEAGGVSTVTVRQVRLSSEATTVTVTVTPVSPAVASDYTLSGNQLTIPAGAMNSDGLVTITAVNNDVDTPNKRVSVRGAATNALGNLSVSPATLTITDDENIEPTGVPTIDDTAPMIGDTLTADASGIGDADGLTGAVYTYRWIRVASDGAETQVGTGQSYTVVAGDVGATLKVAVSFTDDGGAEETVESVATAAVVTAVMAVARVTSPVAEGENAQFRVTRTVVTTGALTVHYRVSETGTMVASGEEGAQSVAFGDGDTEQTVTVPTVEDAVHEADSTVTLTLTADAAYSLGTATADVVVEDDDNADPTGVPTIDNTTPVVGETLTADPSGIGDADGLTGAAYTYRWLRVAPGGTETQVGTGQSYTVVAGDVGATLKVEASFTDDDGTDETVESAETATVTPMPMVAVARVASPVAEGEDAQFRVTRTVSTTGALTVHYRVSETGAMVASGEEGAQSVAFGDGDTAQTVTVPTVEDTVHEADSTVTLTLTADAAYSLGTATADVVVEDDDNADPTGALTIDDTTPVVGETLTANTSGIADADGLTGATYTYRWTRVASGGTETQIGTGQSYTVVAGDVGATLKVEASFTDDDGTEETVESAETAAVTPMPMVAVARVASPVTEGADAQFRVTRTVSTTGALTVHYRVSETGAMVASGEEGAQSVAFGDGDTEQTVTVPTVGDTVHEADSTVTLTLTVDAAYSLGTATADVVVEDDDNAAPTGAPTISDTTPVVGETLTADPSGIGDADGLTGAAYTYRWTRVASGGTETQVGTGQSYTVVAGDVGATLKVAVSFTDDDRTDETVESAETTVVTPPPMVAVAREASPVAEGADAQFRVTRTVATRGALTVNYNVSETGAMVASGEEGARSVAFGDGDTEQTVTVPTVEDTVHEADSTVTLTLTANAAYELGSATADVVVEDDDNAAPTGAPTISDTMPVVGETLTADPSGIVDADGLTGVTYAYRWLRVASGGTETQVGTGQSYTVVAGDVGATLKVAVSFTDDDGTDETVESAETATVTPMPMVAVAPVASPVTEGADAQFRVTRTVSTTGALTVHYSVSETGAMVASGEEGAQSVAFGDGDTAQTVTVPTVEDTVHEADSTVTLTLTADAAYSLGTATADVVVEDDDNAAPTGAPTIDDTTPVVGETLTADPSGIVDADGLTGAAYTYRWLRVAPGGTETQVGTGQSYTVAASDVGATLKVAVSFTDDDGTDETVESAETATVTPMPMVAVARVASPVAEGEDAQFRVTRTVSTTGALTVHYSVSETGAMVASGEEGAQSVAFGDGDTAQTVTVPTVGDTVHEADSTVTLTLTANAAYSLGTATADVVVEDDDNAAPTGAPMIDDTTPVVGETLTANPAGIVDADGLTGATYTWRWLRVASGGTETQVGTGQSYTVVAGDVGATLKVAASFTDDDGTDETVESAETATVTPMPMVAVARVASSVAEGEDAQFRVTRTVSTTGALTVHYSVSETGAMVASGEEGAQSVAFGDGDTAQTVTVPTVGDTVHEADSTVTLTLTADAAYSLGTATANVVVEDDDNADPTGAPTISDTMPVVGETLTADPSGIVDADGLTGAAYTYRWLRVVPGGTETQVGTGQSYTVVAGDVGATLKVAVSFTDDDGTDETVESAETATVTPMPMVAVAPVASPVAEGEDAQFRVTRTGVTAGALTVHYRVSETGAMVASDEEGAQSVAFGDGDTEQTVTVPTVGDTVHEADSTVTLTLTADAAYSLGTATADVVVEDDDNADPTGAPTISDTMPVVGETLTADPSGIVDADGLTGAAYTYRWLRVAPGGTETQVGTGQSYTVAAGDVGATLKVEASFTDDDGTDETVESAETATVTLMPMVAVARVASPVAEGEDVQFRVTRTVSTTGALTVHYRVSETGAMVASGEEGAQSVAFGDGDTAQTVTVPTVGDTVHEADSTVTLTLTANAAYSLGTATADVVVEDDDNAAPTGAPTIDDTTPVVGETLTADPSGIADADGLTGATYTWRWLRVASGGTETQVGTGQSYTVVAGDVGATLRVAASFTDDDGTDETVESAETATVTPMPMVAVARVASPVAEGEDAQFRVTRTGVTAGALTVHYRVSETGAMVASGEEGVQSVAFGDGDTAQTVTVPTVEDTVHEADSTVTLTLTTDAAYSLGTATADVVVEDDDNAAPTGAPTISDTMPVVGETLTADPSGIGDADGLMGAAYTYRWLRVASGGTETQVGTGQSYTVVAGDVGATLKVAVSFTDDDGTDETVESAETATVTPMPMVAVARVASPVAEGADAQFRVTRTVSTTGALTVHYSVSETGAMVASDEEGAQSVAFGDGDTAQTVTVPTVGDTVHEADSTVTLTLTADAAYSLGTATADVVVEDDDNADPTGAPTISDTTPVVGETLTADPSGIGDADGLTGAAYTWRWLRVALGGTETQVGTGQSYTVVAGDVGATLKVAVSFTDDDGTDETVESAETAAVEAAPILPALSIDDASVDEGDTGSTALDFMVSLDRTAPQAVTVDWATSDGSASAGTDYTAGTGSLTFNVGEDRKTVSVTVAGDNVDEPDETFTVTLSGASGATLGDATATGTITDDDDPPTVTLALDRNPVTEAGGVSTVTASLDRPSSEATTVTVTVTPVSPAVAGDYTLSGSQLAIPAGATDSAGLVTVTAVDNAVDAPHKRVTVSATAMNALGVTPPQGVTLTITDDENVAPTGVPTIDDTMPVVGDTLTADTSGIGDTDGVAGVVYAYRWLRVASGGAETQVGSGQSYTVVAADVGATLKVEVSFTDEGGAEETVESVVTATVEAAPLPVVAVAPVTSPVTEGADAQFRVTRTAVTAGALTVHYRVSETGAMVASGEEGAQSVVFGDGDTAQVVTAPTVEDAVHEADSTVTLMLTADATYELGAEQLATVMVEDDDNAAPTGAPTISDTTPVVGDTLTAAASGIGDADGLTGAAYTYRWLRVASGGTETQVGTGQSYTVVAGDVGATLKVEASFTDDDGTAESVTSDETAPVADSNAAPAFADTAVTRSVAENAVAGTNVGAPVVATDADGDTLTYTLSGTGSGNFAVDANGQITVGTGAALDHEALGSYTLTLGVRDGKDAQGNADTAEDASIEVTVNVTDVDEAPVADAGVPQTVAEGAAVTLTGTGTDPEGDSLSYAWSQTGGTPTVALTGADTASASFTAPPQLAQDAALTFTLTVTDAQGATGTDTVTVTVTAGANDAPVADAGTPQTVAEGAAVTLTGTGTDAEGESLTYAWSQTGGTPSVTLTGADTASASFTAPTQLVQDTTLTFTLTVTDARGATGTDTVTVTVTAGSNDAPVADAGTPQTVAEGVTVTLTGTGTDAEGESLTYAWSQTGGTPSVTLTGVDTASASFTAPTQLTEDTTLTFTLTVTDARGATGTDTVTVMITAGSNDAPVADAGTPQTVAEGAAVTLTGTGTDPEGESLTYAWSQTGGTPSVTLTGADTASASFTAPTQLTQDTTLTFTLTVTDARGATGTDTVTVTVTANDAPVADAGTPQTVVEGAAVTLTGTGTDPEGESLSYAWSQTGGTPSVTLTGADTASASFTAPTQLTENAVLTFTLTVTDARGATGTDTVTVTVTAGANDAPVADAGAPQTVVEGAAVTLTGTGADPEGESLTYAWSQTGGTPSVTLTGADTASASFTAPTQLTEDTTLTFTLTVTDARGATGTDTVTVTVTAGSNDAPVADAGAPQTVAEGAAVTLTGTGTDPEGESLTYAWSQTGGTPSVTLMGADTASASFTAPTQLTQDAVLTFTLTVTDARSATGTDTVTVTVTAGSNDAPVADAGTPQTVGEGAAVTLTGTGTDAEGESLTYAWSQTGGTLSVTLTGADTASASFTAPTQLTEDTTLTFTLTVTDARGATGTDTVTVTITAGSNDAPVADAGAPQTVGEGAAVTLTGTGTDPEGESLTYAWSQTGGTLSVTLTGADTASASFTAPTQLIQDAVLTFTLSVTDARGATGTDTVTVTITAGANDAPVANAGTPQTVAEGAAVTLTGTGTDPEGESLTYAWSQTGGTPSVMLTGADTASASFTAPVQLPENTVLTFTLSVTDARGATGTDTVTVTITAGSNNAPVADAGAPQTVGEGVTVALTGTGTDAEGESLSYAWSQTGGTPSVTLTGADTASASFTAPVQLPEDAVLTFTLTVTDARGATGTDTVTVTITAGANDAPVADAGASQTVAEGAAVTLTGTGTDPEGESLTYAWSQTGGTPSVTLTGADTTSASFTAPTQLTQDTTLTFTLTVTDARSATGTDTVTVTVTAGSNDAPVADAGAPQTVGEGAAVTLTGTGTDPEGESLTYAWSQTGGTPSVTLTGADTASASFTAPTQLTEDTTLTFTLSVTDARGAPGTDTVTVTITAGSNDAPVADAGAPQTVGEGVTVTLTGTGTDPEGESLTYAWSQTGGTPSVTLTDADTASASFTAPTQLTEDTTLTFTLTVTDARSATGTDTVTVTVTAGSNDAPVADAGAPQAVAEGAAVALTGTGTDPEGEALTYAWSQTGGTPSVTLTGADTASASFTAPMQLAEDAVLTFTLTVTDARGATGTDTVTVTVTRTPGTDATLSGLSLSAGTLGLAFDPLTTAYTASVSNDVASLTLTPVASDTNATLTVNGNAVTSGQASVAISLGVGDNVITIEVTAEDGNTTRTYRVTVTRAPPTGTDATLSGLSLGAGTLAPTFDPLTTTYTASVSNDVASLALTPAASDTNATLTVNGDAVTSGQASVAIALEVGDNVITIEVTAEDGNATRTYRVTVTRAPPPGTDATLSGLSLGAGALAPAFDPLITAYTASVSNDVASLTLTPAANDTDATLTVNGNAVTSGQASPAIALEVGDNVITIEVTAEDGNATRTYRVTVTRAASPLGTDATLSGLSLGAGTLAPAFDPATTTYTSSVSNDVASLALTPAASDTKATLTVNGNAVTSGQASAAIALEVGDNVITIEVTAEDGSTTRTYTLTVTRKKVLPTFTRDSETRRIAENSPAGAPVGAPVTATGGAPLSYALGGADAAAFSIDADAGQLRVRAALNYEVKSSYSVTVTASDGVDTAEAMVSIQVTDVAEQAGAPGDFTVVAGADAMTLSARWSAASAAGGPALAGYELELRTGDEAFGDRRLAVADAQHLVVDGLAPGTAYDLRLRALNGETPSVWVEASGTTSPPPMVQVGFAQASWETAEGETLSLALTVSGAAERTAPVRVRYELLAGTALAPDYEDEGGGEVEIGADAVSGLIRVRVLADGLSEQAESFEVRLLEATFAPGVATLDAARSLALATIAASDPLTVSLSGPSQVLRGATGSYEVRLAGGEPTEAVRVGIELDAASSADQSDVEGVAGVGDGAGRCAFGAVRVEFYGCRCGRGPGRAVDAASRRIVGRWRCAVGGRRGVVGDDDDFEREPGGARRVAGDGPGGVRSFRGAGRGGRAAPARAAPAPGGGWQGAVGGG